MRTIGYNAYELERELNQLLPEFHISQGEFNTILEKALREVEDEALRREISPDDPYLIAGKVSSLMLQSFRRDLIKAVVTIIEKNNRKIADHFSGWG